MSFKILNELKIKYSFYSFSPTIVVKTRFKTGLIDLADFKFLPINDIVTLI